jgi:hypothetical protein
MLQVEIKRGWWNGNTLEPISDSMLYSSDTKKMCCLGFACEAAGVPKKHITGVPYPYQLRIIPESLEKLVDRGKGFVEQSNISALLTNANDNSRYTLVPRFMTMAAKEAYLIEKGREAGIEFTFVD